jgi:hypothetical protein
MPRAKLKAFSNVAAGVLPTEPKPTPTANPSGKLCTVTAIIRSKIRRQESISSEEFDGEVLTEVELIVILAD